VRPRIAIAGGDHRSLSLSLSRVSDQASLSHAMKDNYVRDQLSSISASVLSWLINRPDHLAMPTLSQLSFQAEGYRHLVCLIANYGSERIGPTIGSRRRNEGWDCDIVIALSQTCPAIHAWYNGTFDGDKNRVPSRLIDPPSPPPPYWEDFLRDREPNDS